MIIREFSEQNGHRPIIDINPQIFITTTKEVWLRELMHILKITLDVIRYIIKELQK